MNDREELEALRRMAVLEERDARSRPPPPDPTEGNSFLQNAAIGSGKAITDTFRGLKQFLGVGDQAALQADIDESRKLDAPLMKTAGGVTGNIATLAAPAFIPGLNTVAGATLVGVGTGALQPTSGDESRLLNTVVGGAMGGAGQAGGTRLARYLTDTKGAAVADAALTAANNAPRDAVLAASKRAGYVVPPTQANPSAWNQLLEGVSGKIKTGQIASQRNQSVTNDLVRDALGIQKGTAITEDLLDTLRQRAGGAYAAIKSMPGTFKADPRFAQEVSALGNDFAVAAKEFPEIASNQAIDTLKSSLSRPDMSPAAAVELIKKLRFDAAKNYKSFDDPAKEALADAQKSAANAIEGLVERNLGANGNQGLMDAFRAARTQIAKTYDVEAALSNGNISAQVLARAQGKGAPLTGGLDTAASFAKEFPKATQDVAKMGSVPATSPLDWYAAIGTSLATGNAAPMVLAGARPSLRSMLLSGPYQGAMTTPNYGAPRTLSLAEIAARGNRAPAAGRVLPGAYFATTGE